MRGSRLVFELVLQFRSWLSAVFVRLDRNHRCYKEWFEGSIIPYNNSWVYAFTFSFCNLTIRIFFLNAWIFKILYYLCNQIQVQIFNVSEIGSLFVYEGLDFLLIQIISLSLYYPIKPFCIGLRKYPPLLKTPLFHSYSDTRNCLPW